MSRGTSHLVSADSNKRLAYKKQQSRAIWPDLGNFILTMKKIMCLLELPTTRIIHGSRYLTKYEFVFNREP